MTPAGLLFSSVVLAGTEIPGFTVISQCFAIGNAVGLYVAYRKRRRDPDADAFVYQTRCALAGFGVGVAIALVSGVLSWL